MYGSGPFSAFHDALGTATATPEMRAMWSAFRREKSTHFNKPGNKQQPVERQQDESDKAFEQRRAEAKRADKERHDSWLRDEWQAWAAKHVARQQTEQALLHRRQEAKKRDDASGKKRKRAVKGGTERQDKDKEQAAKRSTSTSSSSGGVKSAAATSLHLTPPSSTDASSSFERYGYDESASGTSRWSGQGDDDVLELEPPRATRRQLHTRGEAEQLQPLHGSLQQMQRELQEAHEARTCAEALWQSERQTVVLLEQQLQTTIDSMAFTVEWNNELVSANEQQSAQLLQLHAENFTLRAQLWQQPELADTEAAAAAGERANESDESDERGRQQQQQDKEEKRDEAGADEQHLNADAAAGRVRYMLVSSSMSFMIVHTRLRLAVGRRSTRPSSRMMSYSATWLAVHRTTCRAIVFCLWQVSVSSSLESKNASAACSDVKSTTSDWSSSLITIGSSPSSGSSCCCCCCGCFSSVD